MPIQEVVKRHPLTSTKVHHRAKNKQFSTLRCTKTGSTQPKLSAACFCCPILLGRCRFCSFLKLLSYRHTAEAVLLLSKKWPNATSSSFFGFCLSHTLPGGKTRKVRKPSVFIRFDAHVVKAGIKIRGCGPLSTPNIYAKRKIYRFPLDFSAISIFFYCFPWAFLFSLLLYSFLFS